MLPMRDERTFMVDSSNDILWEISMFILKPAFYRFLILLISFVSHLSIVQAQNIGINQSGTAPHPSAMLDVSSSKSGLLIPRVSLLSTTDQTTISAPAISLLVFNTNASIIGAGSDGEGFYYWNGSLWVKLMVLGSVVQDQDWFRQGTFEVPLSIYDSMYHIGNVGIGTNTAQYPLDVKNDVQERTVNVGVTGNAHTDISGVYIEDDNAGDGLHFGLRNRLNGNGSGAHFGVYNDLSGAGTGPKFGMYSFVNPLAGGRHYGIYSDVPNLSNGFAGLFLGKVAFGTDTTNVYTFPLTRGLENQILQTNAAGQITWKDPAPLFPDTTAWKLAGNIGTNASLQFVGTKDDQPLAFRIFDKPSGIIDTLRSSTAFGYKALVNYPSTGIINTVFGYRAGQNISTGTRNVFIGAEAGHLSTVSGYNTAVGNFALRNLANVNGASTSYNVALGYEALFNTNPSNAFNGRYNVGIGSQTLFRTTTGTSNTALGDQAGYDITVGSSNTFLGALTTSTLNSIFNSTAIGSSTQVTASNQIRLGNNTVTSIGGYQDWTNISDGRVKLSVREDVPGLDFILRLRPVTYELDKVATQPRITAAGREPIFDTLSNYTSQEESMPAQRVTGFIAQEVETAANALSYSFSGVDAPKNDQDFYGLRYATFVVPMVKAIQEQDARIVQLESENAALKQLLQELLNELKRLEK